MAKQDKYDYLLRDYPEFINKEQLFRICKISKWSAAFLLKNGMIPCEDNGKSTHKFKIAMRDVIAFLEDRERYPEKYFIPPRPRPKKNNPNPEAERIDAPGYLTKLKAHFRLELEQFEDVLDIRAAGRALGYAHTTVLAWINRGDIEAFMVGRKYLISKGNLLNFMLSKQYRGITQKSAAHMALLRRFSK